MRKLNKVNTKVNSIEMFDNCFDAVRYNQCEYYQICSCNVLVYGVPYQSNMSGQPTFSTSKDNSFITRVYRK